MQGSYIQYILLNNDEDANNNETKRKEKYFCIYSISNNILIIFDTNGNIINRLNIKIDINTNHIFDIIQYDSNSLLIYNLEKLYFLIISPDYQTYQIITLKKDQNINDFIFERNPSKVKLAKINKTSLCLLLNYN